MEIILVFFVAAIFGLFFGGIACGAWWALALIFGTAAPAPDQSTGVLLGCLVLSQITALSILAWAFLEDQ